MPRSAAGLSNREIGAVPDTDLRKLAEKNVLIGTVPEAIH
jgi:hypothetical protein